MMVMNGKTDHTVDSDGVVMAMKDSDDNIKNTEEEHAYENPMPVNPVA